MLVDFENTGFINVHPSLCEEKNTYIPWGFIKGDIAEQSDLMELLTTIESGLTAEQIALLVIADDKLYELQTAIAELDINKITAALSGKANISDVYTKDEVDNLFENIEVDADLTGYATEEWVKQQGYLTEHQSLAGYATESWVKEQNYLTEHQSLDNYYTKSEVDTAIENIEVNVDLSNYYTKGEVNSKLSNKLDTNKIWTGTQDEWDALTATQQNSYIIAMIEV